ncbi:MAG: AgrD family cyclic lactone autoinducer peptide [Lachnotalea sp.]
MYKKIVNKVFPGVLEQAKTQEEKEVVAYGLEVLISNIVNLLGMLIIGIVSDNLLGTVIYLTFFCIIRVQAGGYHANSYLSCFLSSMCMFCFIVGINPHITIGYNMILMVITVISYIVILMVAPILNGKRTFSTEEIKGAKKKVIIIIFTELLVTIVLYHFNFKLFKFASYAVIAEGVFVIMGKIKYWNLNKKALLKNVMNLSLVVAAVSSGWPCLFALYEPEMPRSLKNKQEK